MSKPTFVTGFQRTAGGVEVMYFETREQSRNIGMSRSLIMSDSVEEYNRLVEEACESLEELIELGLADLRNPQKSLNPRERIAAQAEELDDE